MISVGGGIALLLIFVVEGLFLSERRWLRILCWAYLAFYAAALGVAFAVGELRGVDLCVPSLLLVFALFVHEVKRSHP